MAKLVDISLTGDKRLQRKLNRLPVVVQRKIVRRAAREAMRPVLATAKQLAPVLQGGGPPERVPGLMRDTIKIKALKPSTWQKKRHTFGIVVCTAPREVLGIAPDDPYYYPAAVEFGHEASGWYAGGPPVPAYPFMRPAMDQNRRTAINIFSQHVAAELLSEARRG